MKRGLFVTGTDTGVGKTLITAGIVQWMQTHNVDAVPMKPVQTGAEVSDGRLFAPDLRFCLHAAGLHPDVEELGLMSPYLYRPACSPHLAARMEGRYPEVSAIGTCLSRLMDRHHSVIVEGAGGVMVPINEEQTMLDLMRLVDLPVLLVSRLGLGAINHALLSVQVLNSAGLQVAGIIFNSTVPSTKEDGFIEEDNPMAIASFGKVSILGKIPYLGGSIPADAWTRFDRCVPGIGDLPSPH